MIYNFDQLSFQILTICKVEHPKGFFKVRGRPYAALSYRVSGSGSFNFEGKEIVSNPGDILFIPENISYDAEYSGGTMIVVHFLDCNYHIPENITPVNKVYLSDIFSKMLANWETKRYIHATKATIYDIMQFCSEASTESQSISLADQAKQIIDRSYHKADFSITSLAKDLYTSTPTLRRNFTERFDISPKQYLLKVRLDMAVSLLSEGFLSVRSVSERCGFEDERYFSRIIKERYGISPSRISKSSYLHQDK